MAYISNEKYGIDNKKVYAAIARQMKKRRLFPGKIDMEQARTIENLRFTKDEITDLEFLRYFPNLEEFVCYSKNLSNITGLRYVPKLDTAAFINHDLKDITALRHCPNLTFLEIGTDSRNNQAQPCEIGDYRIIGTLTNLTKLDLYNCNISDLSWIVTLNKLEHLYILLNPIQDFSPLLQLTNLKSIEVEKDYEVLHTAEFSHIKVNIETNP